MKYFARLYGEEIAMWQSLEEYDKWFPPSSPEVPIWHHKLSHLRQRQACKH
jgi:hypothetical protein